MRSYEERRRKGAETTGRGIPFLHPIRSLNQHRNDPTVTQRKIEHRDPPSLIESSGDLPSFAVVPASTEIQEELRASQAGQDSDVEWTGGSLRHAGQPDFTRNTSGRKRSDSAPIRTRITKLSILRGLNQWDKHNVLAFSRHLKTQRTVGCRGFEELAIQLRPSGSSDARAL
ncbi:hypothetical protein B0H17DRAFT_1149522 [Mycena rosella]|uniref:Uncharacterized protein n=1 Tax=Mycena rosella TaxID=1033263 RepID=A0AAD7C2M7_MYCRO|nr:hypothetical protein B0H17DRAFT_1149522 [Mycena rosella]